MSHIKKNIIATIILVNCLLMSACSVSDRIEEIFSQFGGYDDTASDNISSEANVTDDNIASEKDVSDPSEEENNANEDDELKEGVPAFYADKKTEQVIEDIICTDENSNTVKLINSSKITFKNMSIGKSGKTLSETLTKNSGLNAALLALSSSEAIINDCEILTEGVGAPAVYINGTGSKGRLGNVSITTSDDLSMGISAAQRGFVDMLNVKTVTNGEFSAGIFIGEGGGKMSITGGSVNTNGANSPGIYSNGTLAATGLTLNAAYSPAVEISNRNNVFLTGTILTSGRENAVTMYEYGNAVNQKGHFLMVGGSFESSDAASFYLANTVGHIELQGVKFSGSDTLLRAEKNDLYGVKGSQAELVINMQEISGNISADDLSTLDISIKNFSKYNGSINNDNTAKYVKVYIDANSTWELTEDCYVDELTVGLADFSNIVDNGFCIYYNPEKTKLGGKTFDLPGGGVIASINGEPNVTDDTSETTETDITVSETIPEISNELI